MANDGMPGAGLPTLNSLWIGDNLPLIEQICAHSMLHQGHRLRIFTYGPITGVPDGVEIADANTIVARDEILRYAKPGFKHRQMASNIFRYQMLARECGIWVDLDMLLLKPIAPTRLPLFGLESADGINTAVLYLPPAHPLLASMLAFTSTPFPIPPFFTPRMKFGLWRRKWAGQPVHAADQPWGVFGPTALTYFARRLGYTHLAQPKPVFYPIRYTNAHGPLTAGWNVKARLSAQTIGIHLWSHNLFETSSLRPQQCDDIARIEPGSFLHEFAREALHFRV